jgi:hypothetical protein
MTGTIREREVGDYLLVSVSHVTDDGVGIVGRSGKLHLPDCDRAGELVAVRVTADEAGYIVGEQDWPSADTDAALYIQRGDDPDASESDELEEVDFAEWRRRWFAHRVHDSLPGPLAARFSPESFSTPNWRTSLRRLLTLGVIAAVALLGYVTVTVGLDALGAVGSFASKRPGIAFVITALAVLGVLHTYAGFLLFELYVTIAGGLAGAAAGFTVGSTFSPAFAAQAVGPSAPGVSSGLNAILFGMLPILFFVMLGGTLGAKLAKPLLKLSVLVGGFASGAYVTALVLGAGSLVSNPSTALSEAPLVAVLAIVVGSVGAILAWFLHVLAVVVLTSAAGAAMLATDVVAVTAIANGSVPTSIPAILDSLVVFSIPFALFFITGVLLQFGATRLIPGIESGDDSVDPLKTPSSREDWEPPSV